MPWHGTSGHPRDLRSNVEDGIAEDLRTDQALHRVEDLRVAHQRVVAADAIPPTTSVRQELLWLEVVE